MKYLILIILSLVIGGINASANAAGKAKTPPEVDWSFDGPFGTYDRGALQRGFLVYKQVCSACHGMDHLYYRNLTALGYTENQVKNIAAEYTVTDGPNDEGEMFQRPAKPSDHFANPYPNEAAAKYANNGAYPPDMSLIVKARKYGADYVKALLVGYADAPPDVTLMTGQYYNKYMAGNIIAMAPPLADDMIVYEDGTPQTAEQYARDVAHFLKWAADPYMEERKQTGIKVIIFLIVFAGIMYAFKKKTWSEGH